MRHLQEVLQTFPKPRRDELIPNNLQTIVLGGGCFWCTEAVYVQVQGVCDVESGYCNGLSKYPNQPSYAQVCTGETGYVEVVKLVFEPARVSLRELLEVFFLIHDPTTLNQQGHDRGTQYRSGIYFTEAAQQEVALSLVDELSKSGVYQRPIVTEVQPLTRYWPAEEEHQDFFEKNPHQAYCMAVAAPKVAKFRRTFARLQKT